MKGLLAILLIYCFSLPMSRAKPIDVLIYSATAWFRHAEIPQLNGFLVRLGDKNNINVSVTEDPTDLKSENLKKYNLLLFNNSTNLGESIPREIQKEIINWFKSGGGIMAMHAGIVQNGTWPELIEIAGCDFDSDSDYMEARFLVDPKTAGDPLLAGKKKQFMYTADWLCFNRSVTGLPGVEVLLRLDEKSYTPIREHPSYVGKKPMGNDHPICWRRKLGKGRYLFTGLGHDIRSINTEFARKHIIAAIRWTANSAKSIEKSQSN
ncbi:MAG: ThuA domain-containing protein [Verrucomicrobiota bacterium]|nr:ThuA domain-containing protein [Verrucomicrobiota bacterium]MED6300409.1 ThuA domain-containing protein [Verrucomicrobiota bacterium]MEE2966360.1 ThuA domain-containing protein [Verrucomicrobiota bacterium]MEE3177353.1 ThuA domain-containing protein [Verrucomicrobiota bacterium]